MLGNCSDSGWRRLSDDWANGARCPLHTQVDPWSWQSAELEKCLKSGFVAARNSFSKYISGEYIVFFYICFRWYIYRYHLPPSLEINIFFILVRKFLDSAPMWCHLHVGLTIVWSVGSIDNLCDNITISGIHKSGQSEPWHRGVTGTARINGTQTQSMNFAFRVNTWIVFFLFVYHFSRSVHLPKRITFFDKSKIKTLSWPEFPKRSPNSQSLLFLQSVTENLNNPIDQ